MVAMWTGVANWLRVMSAIGTSPAAELAHLASPTRSPEKYITDGAHAFADVSTGTRPG